MKKSGSATFCLQNFKTQLFLITIFVQYLFPLLCFPFVCVDVSYQFYDRVVFDWRFLRNLHCADARLRIFGTDFVSIEITENLACGNVWRFLCGFDVHVRHHKPNKKQCNASESSRIDNALMAKFDLPKCVSIWRRVLPSRAFQSQNSIRIIICTHSAWCGA